MGETCAKCGKNIGWLESRYGWNIQLFNKGYINHCLLKYGPEGVFSYDGQGVEFPEYKGKKICGSCAYELMTHARLCQNCGYFEEITHDLGGVDSSGTFVDNSYSTFKCRKFSFDLKKQNNMAGNCSSYILKSDYRKKCLNGEMEKDKANVQVILDFSSLKDVMSKGGIVMTTHKCPNCNGMVDIPETGKVLICKYCGTPIKPVDIFEKIKSLIQSGETVTENPKQEVESKTEKQEDESKPDWYKEALKQHIE